MVFDHAPAASVRQISGVFLKQCNFDGYEPSKNVETETASGQGSAGIHGGYTLLRVLSDIATETAFTLKGGMPINLFHRDMPRLSVDIDLTCLPVADRQSSSRTSTILPTAMGRIVPTVDCRLVTMNSRA